jgi:hypothetical protein
MFAQKGILHYLIEAWCRLTRTLQFMMQQILRLRSEGGPINVIHEMLRATLINTYLPYHQNAATPHTTTTPTPLPPSIGCLHPQPHCPSLYDLSPVLRAWPVCAISMREDTRNVGGDEGVSKGSKSGTDAVLGKAGYRLEKNSLSDKTDDTDVFAATVCA